MNDNKIEYCVGKNEKDEKNEDKLLEILIKSTENGNIKESDYDSSCNGFNKLFIKI